LEVREGFSNQLEEIPEGGLHDYRIPKAREVEQFGILRARGD